MTAYHRIASSPITASRRLLRAVLVMSFGALLVGSEAAWGACSTAICGASPCTITGTNVLDDACILDFGTKDVIVGTGASLETADGNSFTVLAHDLTVRGKLRARAGFITVEVTGAFKTEVVSNSLGTVDVSESGSVDITADGACTLNGKNIDADGESGFSSGDISISCASVTGSSAIHCDGSGAGDGGSITIAANTGAVDLTGNLSANGGGPVDSFAWGGPIEIEAATTLTLGTSGTSKSVQAKAAGGGFAGSITLTSGGAAAIHHALNVNGGGDTSDGGEISVDASSVTATGAWSARGDDTGSGGTVSVIALTSPGTITTASTNSIDVPGASGGGWGGSIDLTGIGAVTLSGDMDAGGNGESAFGGSITIEAGSNHTLTVNSTSRIEADSTGTDASDGSITMTACNISQSGALDTRNGNLDSGTNTFTYQGTMTCSAGSSTLADDPANSGENRAYCRCVDTSPADGTCDTPLTCVSNPTCSGTVTPSLSVSPVALPACG